MKRLHIILAALLAVQIAVGVLVFWPRTGTGIEAEPLFSDVPIESIITLTIIDDIGNTLVLKNAAGVTQVIYDAVDRLLKGKSPQSPL